MPVSHTPHGKSLLRMHEMVCGCDLGMRKQHCAHIDAIIRRRPVVPVYPAIPEGTEHFITSTERQESESTTHSVVRLSPAIELHLWIDESDDIVPFIRSW